MVVVVVVVVGAGVVGILVFGWLLDCAKQLSCQVNWVAVEIVMRLCCEK